MIERFYTRTINVKRLVPISGTDKEIYDFTLTTPCYYEKSSEFIAKLWCGETDPSIVEGDEITLEGEIYVVREIAPYTRPTDGSHTIHHLEIILELMEKAPEGS